MKTIIQTLFFFLLVTQICFAQWVQVGLNDESIIDIAVQNSTIFAVTLDSCYQNYWGVSSCNGKGYRSIDGGTNWTMIADSNAVDFAISPTGKLLMVQDSLVPPDPFNTSDLFFSSDNGDTWVRVNIVEQLIDSIGWGWPRNITFSPEGTVFCGIRVWDRDYFHTTAKSTDDGLTWTTPGMYSGGGILFDFKNQYVITIGEIATIGGYGNGINLSSDYGNTWTNLGYVATSNFYALGFFSNHNIIVGGSYSYGPNSFRGALYISTDMCSTWSLIDTLINSQVGLSYSNGSTEGMIIGTEELGVFLFSDEGDSLGSRNEGLTNLNVQALSLDNNGYVYAGTDNGVWRRPLSEVTSVEENQIEIPSSYILSQNFPNPFNPSTKIKYSVPQSSQVQIKIYDVLGNEIETLVKEEKPAGTYELTWNAVNLPSGIYFYQLRAGRFIETKKMILLK
jgi:hypothetical protein